MPSTYNTRFFFRLESVRGREFRIDIKELGYSGPAEQRHLGATPVLKQDEGGNGIFGTSLEIIAECATDNEFAELYTSDPRKFYVTLTDVTAAAVIWDGFVSPELYSAPEIAPPYDVQIIAVDGLGELKRYNFPASGRQTLLYHLQTILDFSGLDSGNSKILIVDSLNCATPSVSAAGLLGSVSVDLDHFADDGLTCYEALEAILRTLNLTITRRACKWLLVRESDVDIDGSAISARTAGGTAVTLPVIEYGSMRTHEWWPVGRMENEIDPAKSAIAALYVFRMQSSMLANPSLETGTGWTYPARTQGAQNYVSWVPLKGTSRPGLTAGGSAILTDQSADIYQDIQVEAFSGPLTLRLLTMNFMADVQTFGGEYKVYFDLILQASGGNRYVLKIKDGKAEWLLNPGSSASPNSYTAQKLIGFTSSTDIPISAFNSDEFSIPGIPAAGTLRVRISAITKLIQTVDSYFILGGVYLLQDSVPGYKDSIVIDNSARGAAGDVDMAFGDRPVVANALLNFRNILTASGALTSEWATSQFTGEFLSVIAMDNALGVSLPRLIARGTLNVPVSESLPTVIVNPDGMPMLIRRYSWKLLDDELDVDLLSVPSASIEITSETIRDLTDEEARAASGSGYVSPAGSGGSSTFIGGPRYFEDVEDERGDRIGAKALYDLFIIQQEADEEETPEVLKNISEVLRHLFLVEVDGVPYIRADIGFFSDSSVSAGGLSTSGGGGGGGGIDPAAMWALLAAPTAEPINVTHIASILTQYATQAWVQSQGYLTNADLPEPFDPLPIVTRLADHSARIEALESWLDMPVLDELAVASLTVERSLSLGGTALVYDYEHDAWRLLGNFYADGFVSAGGVSDTGSGSGGGIDPAAMWALLGAATGEQINASHLGTALTPYATKVWVQAQGYLTRDDLPDLYDDLPLATAVATQSERIATLERWFDLPVLDELETASLTVTNSVSVGGMALVYDAAHDAWHLMGNFYADGFVSAGGISDTESGSGGGINADAMWALLGAATAEQINASHLAGILTDYATKAWVQSQITPVTYQTVTTALGYVPLQASDLLPITTQQQKAEIALAGRIAEHSERLASVERWLDMPVLDELAVASLTVERSLALGGATLVYDYAHDAWHLMGNFYADGFVSAGGISDTESGSGGGINADAMWALLGAATAEQINASHLAGILTDYATKAWVQSQITPVTYQTVTTALGYVPLQASDLLPITTQQQKAEIALAGRIAEHSERLASVERWFDLPVLDELAVASLTVDRSLALGGATLVYDYAHDAWHLMGNFYADGFVSAGGISDTEGGSGGGIDADALWQLLGAATSEPVNATHLPLSVTTSGSGNYVTGLSYSGGVFTVSKATLPTSYVTSVGLAAPTGFSVSGTPITSTGTLRLGFATGYALPLSADTTKGVTAYGWGDHAQAGYAMAASLEATQLALSTRLATQETRLASVERWLNLPVLDELNVASLRVERSFTLGAITMVFDYVNNAWHIKGNMYADGFVSAGGYSGAHTTGGITETALWQLLGAATGEQISITHLTTALDPYATKQWVIDQGGGVVTYQAVIEALGYVPLAPDDMLPLTTAIGRQEQRIASLERWFEIPVLDELNAASLRVERSLAIGPITLTYDYANAALHVVGNMYADGFVSAGGMSDNQSGTGGGIDADAMWALLSAATTEQVNASHLPLSVTTIGTGNYVASLSYLGGVFTATMAALPTALPSPQALTFGTKTYNGSAARTLVASDLGAVTQSSVVNRAATLTSGTTVTLAEIGSVNITAVVPAFAAADHTHAYNTLTGLPTALKNPYALTFGSNSYDGSAAKTITASDLGAVTQSSVENKAATLTAGATVTLAKIGTVNVTAAVPAFALASALANYLPLTGGTMANTNRVVDLNADLLDGQHGTYYATAAGLSDTNAAITTLSQETAAAIAALTASQETAELSLGTALAAQAERLASLDRWFDLPVLGELSVTSLTVERSISVGGTALVYDYEHDAWHLLGNFYADGFVSAGGMSDNQSGTGGIDAGAMWQLLGAATTEPIAASHLPLSVAVSGSGDYVASLSYSGGVFTATMAALPTLPTALPNPQALTFGSKTYDGSAPRTLVASDIGALTQHQSVDNKNASLSVASTVTVATIGTTDITVRVPNFALTTDLQAYLSRSGGSMATTSLVTNLNANLLDGHHSDWFARAAHSHAWADIADRPSSLPNPSPLVFGDKSYDGSSRVVLAASDIGALTQHQNVSNKAATLTAGSTVTLATVGSTNITAKVPAFALTTDLQAYLSRSGGSMASTSLVKNLNADLLDGQHGSYYAAASVVNDLDAAITRIDGYFSGGVAKSALRLSGTAARTAWGQTFWSNGVPASISGAMSSVSNIDALLYFNTSTGRVGVGTGNPAYVLDVDGTIRATGHVYAQDRLYLGGNSAYIHYDGNEGGIHASVGFYSDSFISAGGVSTTSDERLKDHIVGISESRARQVLAALRPVEFRWKCGGAQSAGFIAQEVEIILPWAVTELGGVKRLQYDVLFTYGMAGLNALLLRQETHEQKILRLEHRVEYLENELRKHQ